jgi:predicted  nucleic acid-binding Zn-ribbon protein
MREIIGLARIQRLDTQIDKRQSRLEIIEIELTDDQELQKIQNSLLEHQELHKISTEKLEISERRLQENTKKIELSEANLYSGNTTNPKELQDGQNEISSLKRLRTSLEEVLLEDMMTIEEISDKLEASSSFYQISEVKFNQGNRDLIKEKDTIIQEIAVFLEERKAVEGSLSDDSIKLYNKLRNNKNGSAISFVSEGVCGSCGSTLTPSQEQSIKSSNSLIPCSTCGRLLYSQ